MKTPIILFGFVLFLLLFAFALLTYTRRVDGVSMLPTLEEGDLVVIEPVQMSSIHVGDIVVYDGSCSGIFYGGTPAPVIHRVANITGRGLITRGDNGLTNPRTDQEAGIARRPITQDCIEGKVVFVVPYVERLATLPDGLNYVLAALIVAAVLVYELRGRIAESMDGSTLHQTRREEAIRSLAFRLGRVLSRPSQGLRWLV
jgi:signal peptidase I